jgi:hypothetical protein
VRTHPRGLKQITFTSVEGHIVPSQPWPQAFYTSGQMWHAEIDAFEVRPLTVTGIVKGIGRNFITMNYWRILRLLLILGFLPTKEGARMSWSTFTLRSGP